MKGFFLFFLSIFLFLLPLFAHAHEVYVLTPTEFSHAAENTAYLLFSPLAESANLLFFLLMVVGICILFAGQFFFQHSRFGFHFYRFFEEHSSLGFPIIRITLGFVLLYCATTGTFPGPELSFATNAGADTIRWILGVTGTFFIAGLFTEFAGATTIALFIAQVFLVGPYLFTYLHYFAPAVIFFLFGSRSFSLDGVLFSRSRRMPHLHELLIPFLRVSFGLALLYTAITVKLFHPALPLAVATKYNLAQFHYLFPSDAGLIVLGASLAEILIALLIIVGFELRFTLLVGLFYSTLSLWYFGEVEWPHYMMYAVSVALLLFPAHYSLDAFFSRRMEARRARKSQLHDPLP